jgi:hypothetical protein
MKLALHFVLLTIAFVCLSVLHAQTTELDTVNLAILSEINLSLNDNCQDSLILQEVASGDFDVDGNGISYSFSDFSVIVEDGDETNGPIIDGCGVFSFRVEAAPNVIGFTTGWGVVNAEDKTPPFFTANPSSPEGPLYCDLIDEVDINLLPNTVSRCYRVDTETGNIIPGSLNNQLRDRLIAGGGLPQASDNCSPQIEICITDIVERDPVNPQCEPVTIFRTFTVTDGGCPSVSGEDNQPAVISYPIVFTRPTLDDLDATNVTPVVTVNCDDLEGLGLQFGDLPAPRQQDLPFFNGPGGTTIPLSLGQGGSFCNIGVTFEDSPLITTCALAYKAIRTYTLIDWCNPSEVETFTQILKIGDFTAPEFTAPTQDIDFDGQVDEGPLQFQTNAGNQCGAYIRLDDGTISLTDLCSSTLTLSASIYPNQDLGATPFGAYEVDLNDNNAEITNLIPAGTHLLRYTYRDDCDNIDFTDVVINITDGTAPVAICENGLNIGLTAGVAEDGTSTLGLATITPEMINRSSYDDCTDITFAIGRVQQNADGSYGLVPGATYSQRIDFFCEDLGTVLVGLEVADDGDNRNYCWMTVLVEDKLAPVCTPPSTINLTCSELEALGLPANIQETPSSVLDVLFGEAFATDNCSINIFQNIAGSVNTCGDGTYERSFRIFDGSGFATVCNQFINVISTFDYTISFPGDVDAFCMESPDLADIEVSQSTCDLITTDVTIDTFQSQVNECYLLRITHHVINFCEYNTLGQAYVIPRDIDGDNDNSERTFVHLLPLDQTTDDDDVAWIDTDGDRNNGFSRQVDDGNDNDGTDDFNGNDSENSQAPNGIGYAYAQDNSRGSYVYYQFASIYDEVAPEITVDTPAECFGAQGVNCTGSVELTFQLSDACTVINQIGARLEIDGDYIEANGFVRNRFLLEGESSTDGAGNYTINLNNVPVGSHAIRVRATDGCGNVDVSILEFCVSDELAPTPICIGQLTVTLMPNGDGTGNAAIWATDFIASDIEDCSGEVTYSIYTGQEASMPGFEAAPGQPGIILDCQSDATVPIRVYAFDPAGRGDYCSVFVLVQQAENACVNENTGNIGGVIVTENGGLIANVAIGISSSDTTRATTSDGNGRFLFDNLLLNDDFTIDAVYDDYINHSQGVSTFDLVLITEHILGTAPLTSPYQLLAADANNDQEISVQDLIAIRRLILGYDDSFPGNTGYRFVDVNFIFPIGTNPWATSFPEVVNINNLSANVFDADFIGVMVGDVNGNGLTNNFASSDGQPRSGAVALSATDLLMAAGQTYDIAITAGQTAGLKGLQGTLAVNEGASISGVRYGQFGEENVNTALTERGLLSFSFNGAASLDTKAVVLYLSLTAEQNIRLSDALSITDELVFTEAYTVNNRVVNLRMNFTTENTVLAATKSVFNYPNPMAEQTTVYYNLPQAGKVNFSITDLNGRRVFAQQVNATSGENQLVVRRADIGVAGVYTYTVKADGMIVSRKLVVK